MSIFTPQVLSPSDPHDLRLIQALKEREQNLEIIDELSEQLTELAEVENPGKTVNIGNVSETDGVWVYYPWRNTIVRVLPMIDYHRLRSSRNELLISRSDQEKFRTARVGIAGLNVGNPAALCMALEGGANKMKFADFDTLSVSNLNRFRAGLPDLGINKAVLSARQVYEINPFAKLEVWQEGIKPGEESKFLENIDVLVEEMDNLPLKVSIREAARAKGIPVVMVTGNGANVIIDIERYDIDPDLPILNGYLKQDVLDTIHNPPSKLDLETKVNLARDFMGKKFLTPELNESFNEIGKSLAGIPQLAESSFLRGAAVCYVIRQIVTGKVVPSGRYNLNLDEVLA